MATGWNARAHVVATVAIALALASSASARLNSWAVSGCDTPAVFYSPGGGNGPRPMCCANVDRPSIGVCPGGILCPSNGQCPSGGTCVPVSHPYNDLPNIVVIYSDDQPYCGYGFMGSCRTDRDGTPVPAPATPSLDDLAKRAKVFTVAHNVAPWCIPSRDAVLSGRLPSQRSCVGTACRPPGAHPDPTPPLPRLASLISKAGPGYCSYQAGKGLSKVGFDAVKASRKTARTPCSRCGSANWSGIDPLNCQFDPSLCPNPADPLNPNCQTAPKCGGEDPNQLPGVEISSTGEVDSFIADLVATGSDGKSYLPKKFMVWFAPALPHTPVAPSDVIEHRPHVTNASSQDICKDFLFGYLCRDNGSGGVDIVGPRFPFGAPPYAAKFAFMPRSNMQGLYGNIYWMDNAIGQLRKVLVATRVETATGSQPLSNNTVIMFMTDNGAFMVRSKKHFTENGYRSPFILYDPRHETPAGGEWRVEDDIAYSLDIVPTVLSYAGVPQLTPAEAPGKNLRPRVENGTPPTRNALCGTDIKSLNGTTARYILPRGGAIGQCSAPTGNPCVNDGDCAAGSLCGTDSQCAIPTKQVCIDDDDCRTSPSDPAVCRFQERKWCSGNPTQACTTDAECRTSCRACTKAPSRTCQVNGDCGAEGPCINSDTLACSCLPRRVKLYNDETGAQEKLSDLLSDPDEWGLVDGSANANASANPKVTHRLRCCMDAWWTPPAIPAASCPSGCDARVDCSL